MGGGAFQRTSSLRVQFLSCYLSLQLGTPPFQYFYGTDQYRSSFLYTVDTNYTYPDFYNEIAQTTTQSIKDDDDLIVAGWNSV